MNTAVDFPYLLDTDRVTTWYYRDAPDVGAVVMYANEVYIDVVERVTLTHVWLVSGRALRRPYLFGRLVVWSIHKYRTRKHRTTNRMWIDTRDLRGSVPSTISTRDSRQVNNGIGSTVAWSASIV